ncbi:MAG: hypothetical protein ACRBCT_01880 [Alphaproteobacteria bacterium]
MKPIQTKSRKNESGNVLFLILIAVALFAALSYAVTSSTRSGGGDANDETNLVNTAAITQYPTGIRTSLIRMQVSKGIDPTDMEFNPPSDFGNCSTSGTDCVFHPSGGNATYAPAIADVMANGAQGTWTFNGDFEIVNVGLTSSGAATGNEIIAFLPGIKQAVCSRINTELGISGIPDTGTDVSGTDDTTEGYNRILDNGISFATTNDITIGTGGDAVTGGALDGQAFGCFQNNGGEYVYYHVIYES